MKKTAILFLIVLFFISCSDEFKVNLREQQVLFQYEYINYAWSYQHSGWFIDTSGNLISYSLPAKWSYPDSLGFVTETAIIKNLSYCSKTDYIISKSVLQSKIELIEKSAKGTLTKPRYEMADAGVQRYTAFIFNKDTKQYKRILLYQWGDELIENTSAEAKELYKWMAEINLKDTFQPY
ncbi:MAG: hypothetical protein ACOYM7_02135 [Paludibacter sp.]